MRWILVLAALALLVVPASRPAAPASGAIVFASTRAPFFHDEVIVLDPATGARRNLSRSPYSDREPAVSPDGRAVAFVSDRDGAEAVWVVGVDGSRPRRVAGPYPDTPSGGTSIRGLAWRPGGDGLAYVVDRPRPSRAESTLYVAALAGGRSTAVAKDAQWAAWAPAGERLAVGRLGAGGLYGNVAVVEADGRRLWQRRGDRASWSANGSLAIGDGRRVGVYTATGRLRFRRPSDQFAWQPGGKYLAVARGRAVSLIGDDGSTRRLVTGASQGAVVDWSPDGRLLLYRDRTYRGMLVDVSQGSRTALPPGIEPIGWLAGGRLLAYAFDRQGAGLAVLRPPFATVRITARARGGGSACFNGIGFGGALPDGTIVATSGHGSQSPSDLWTVAVAGGPPRRLAGSPRTWEGSPSRSPGGDLLLFQRGDVLTHGGSCQGPLEPVLWVARADGSRARPLSRAPSEYGWEDTMAAWSSDGRRVAYLHQSLGGSEEDGVYVVDLAGGPPTRVAGRAGWPSWSPEGRELVLETEGGIEVVTADGRERRSLGAGRMPSWSPDGSAIALLRGRTVWTVEPDGGGVARKVVLAAWYPGGLARAVPYRWSPDGSRLALADERGIVVVRRDGGARRILAKRGAREVAWSPEGDRLAFTAVVGRIGRAERTELFVVGANGGAPVRLTRDLADVTGPAWASR